MKSIRLPLSILLVAALLLSGCKPSGSEAPAASTSSSPVAAVATAPHAAPPPAVAATSDCVAQASADTFASKDSPPTDKTHPSLKVTTFDCKTYDLSSQRGHWVLVNFWATWCGPCLAEMPDLTRFARAHPDVSLIGVDFEDGVDAKTMAAFIKEHAPGYPIAVVGPDRPLSDFGLPRGLPTSYLIGPDGAVAGKLLGPLTLKDLEHDIGHR